MRTACTLASFTLFTSMLFAANAPAQQPKPAAAPPNAPAGNADALTVYSAGIDALLVDPRDAGLLRALRMLDERVLELPNEVGDDSMPAPAIQFALQLLKSPMSLRAGLLDMQGDAALQGPPFYGQLSFFGSNDAAAAFAGRFSAMIAEHGAPPATPAANMPGMQTVDADGVPLYFGTMKSGTGGAFVLGVNQVGAAEIPAVASGLPNDVKPVMTFMLDMQKLQPLVEMFMAQAGDGPEMEMMRMQLAMAGMYGPNAGQLVAAVGHGKDRAYGWGKYSNYRKLLEAGNALPSGSLVAADLKRVPADATYAQVSKVNLNGLMTMIKSMAGQAMEAQGMGGGMGGDDAAADPFKFIEDATGINPQRDIVDHLGQTIGSYMADSTGGGGLSSLVMFAEVKNAEGLEATRARIRGMINQLGQEHAKGYVRVAEREMGGHKVLALTFPGLPIPLEICSTIADGYLYVAGSATGLQVAVAQGKSGRDSLMDNKNFKEMGGHELKDAMQVTYLDTPRMVHAGYGLVSMGMTALANAVRSPTDLDRDPGVIMPSFAEMTKDARASVSFMRLVGDDLIMTSQSDRSALVNACGVAGAMGGMTGVLAVGALMAGVMMPAMSQAREQAIEIQNMSQIREVGMAMNLYAANNADALPTKADDLLNPGYIEAGVLTSPYGPVGDESGDVWLNLTGGKLSAIADPSQYVIAYDRAMFAASDTVAVVFLDGHVETLGLDDFRQLVAAAQHQGIDFKLPS